MFLLAICISYLQKFLFRYSGYFLIGQPPDFCIIPFTFPEFIIFTLFSRCFIKLCFVAFVLVSHFSCVRLCATPQMAAHQAPPSLGFSRQGHWSGLPFPSPVHESEVTQSCLTLSDPMNCSLPGSSVHGIFQARVLEWGAIAFSLVAFILPSYINAGFRQK